MPIHVDPAPIGRRTIATVIDCFAAFAFYWSVVHADLPLVEEQFIALASIGFVLAALAATRVFPGQSPGKYLMSLLILSADASQLSLLRQTARNASRLLLSFALSFGFAIAGVPSLLQAYAIALLCTSIVEMLCSSLRTDGKSMADLLFKTRVVRLPPLQPHRAPAGPMYSATDAEFGKSVQPPKGDA